MPAYNFRAVSVLLVDDNSYMRRLAKVILRGLGINHVREAADGAEALMLLQEDPADLIFCDLSMAPIDGLEFVRRLRRGTDTQRAMAPVVMVTAHTDRTAICAARDAGVTEFLAKPLSPRAMVERIVEVIERPRSFVRASSFMGPDRRRRRGAPPGAPRRRRDDDQTNQQAETVEI